MNALRILGFSFALGFLSIETVLGLDCETVSQSVTKKVEEDPDQVLVTVEDAMASHDKCACEIVKAAIVASRADGRLVGEIVFTAVTVSQSMAPTVAECAVSVAPDSAPQIRAALKRALSDTGRKPSYGRKPSFGKNPYGDKEPIPSAEPVEDGFDFGRTPLDVRGIYLLAPSPGGGGQFREDSHIPDSLAKRFKKVFGFFPNGLDRDQIIKLLKRNKKESGSSEEVIVRPPATPSDPESK